MSKQLTTVLIVSGNHGGKTPILINGALRKTVIHGVETDLDDEELEALRHSVTGFTIVGGGVASSPQAAGEAGPGGSASPVPDDAADAGDEAGKTPEASDVDADASDAGDASGDAGSTLNVEPFDAAATLNQSIKKIGEDLDEFTAEQLSALIAAEKAKDQPRTTLIDALEKKLAAITAPAPTE